MLNSKQISHHSISYALQHLQISAMDSDLAKWVLQAVLAICLVKISFSHLFTFCRDKSDKSDKDKSADDVTYGNWKQVVDEKIFHI